MNDDKVFVLRHALRIPKAVYQPYPNPETGQLPDHVKVPDSNGDIHLTAREEEQRNLGKVFLKSTINIEVEDGRTFDLNKPMDLAVWEAIKWNPDIADSRTARDEKGNLIIDGDWHRYGRANFWVERANAVTNTTVNKEELVLDAKMFVKKDSPEGLILKMKLLGKYVNTMTINDLKEYLYGIAAKDPNQIIDLYEGTDTNIRLMLVEAQEKGAIEIRDNIYYFGRNTILGANTDSVIAFLKAPSNVKLLDTIRQTIHPTAKGFTEIKPEYSQPVITPAPEYSGTVSNSPDFIPSNVENGEDIKEDDIKEDKMAKARAAKIAKKAQKLANERGYGPNGEEVNG